MKHALILLTLGALLVLASSVLAMSSVNYHLDWFTRLTGGGGPAESSSYAVNLTVGQGAIGVSSSDTHQACLGYWCRAPLQWVVYLPYVVRNR